MCIILTRAVISTRFGKCKTLLQTNVSYGEFEPRSGLASQVGPFYFYPLASGGAAPRLRQRPHQVSSSLLAFTCDTQTRPTCTPAIAVLLLSPNAGFCWLRPLGHIGSRTCVQGKGTMVVWNIFLSIHPPYAYSRYHPSRSQEAQSTRHNVPTSIPLPDQPLAFSHIQSKFTKDDAGYRAE